MTPITRKISNFLRSLIWIIDYIIFLVFNPFKFKRCPRNFKKILIVERLYIGDSLVITPVIRALKEKYNAQIFVMVNPSMIDVLSGNPNIEKFLSFGEDDFEKNFDKLINVLKKEKFDLAILLHPGRDVGNYKVSKLLYKAKIPFRVGCTRVGFLEGKGFFLHRKTRPTLKYKHKAEDNLDVIRTTLGINYNNLKLEAYTTKKAELKIKKFLDENRIKKYVVIHGTSKHKTHLWLKKRFAQVADEIFERYSLYPIFTTSKDEKSYVEGIVNCMKNRAYIFSGDIKEFFSIIKNSELVISIDTSAMHIAAAFDKPVIALFGAGNPKIWRPLTENSIVIFKDKEVCTSCMKYGCRFVKNPFLKNKKKAYECMKAIKVDDVLKAVDSLLKRQSF